MFNFYINPFKSYQFDLCCGDDDLRPWMNYIYFVNGIAYACDGHVLIAFSLKDIGAENDLVNFLEGYKIKHEDLRFLSKYYYFHLQKEGLIFLHESGSRQMQLLKLEFEDENKSYQKIIDIFNKAQSEINSHSTSLNSISVNLKLLEKLSGAFGEMNSVELNFLIEPPRIFVKSIFHKNSFAIVMPLNY